MKTVTKLALATSFALALASAAQAQSPQVPTQANPYPANPIATDGSPLPRESFDTPLRTGRSAFAPVGDVISVVPDTIDTITNRR